MLLAETIADGCACAVSEAAKVATSGHARCASGARDAHIGAKTRVAAATARASKQACGRRSMRGASAVRDGRLLWILACELGARERLPASSAARFFAATPPVKRGNARNVTQYGKSSTERIA
eukprot:3490478-Pleurochrysis_carterae.AAC.3